jgi:hypothetical protein
VTQSNRSWVISGPAEPTATTTTVAVRLRDDQVARAYAKSFAEFPGGTRT